MHQNYPIPFNPSTVIRCDLPRDVEVRLCVYDVLGRVVGVLVDGRVRAGRHSVEFWGDGLSSGVYFFSFEGVDVSVLVSGEEFVFKPTGESPLARCEEFINTTCPKCGAPAKEGP